MTTTHRYVNPNSFDVHIPIPGKRTKLVCPVRELEAGLRKEEDCVVEGEYFANFPGLLVPFPGADAQGPRTARDLDPMDPSDVALAARMASGKFTGSGEVLDANGNPKVENQAAPPATEAATEPGSEDPESGDDSEDGEDDEVEYEDLDLTDVTGIGAKLAESLTEHGITTAAQLADYQTERQLERLLTIPGVRGMNHAKNLVTSAQTALGWEDVPETDGDED